MLLLFLFLLLVSPKTKHTADNWARQATLAVFVLYWFDCSSRPTDKSRVLVLCLLVCLFVCLSASFLHLLAAKMVAAAVLVVHRRKLADSLLNSFSLMNAKSRLLIWWLQSTRCLSSSSSSSFWNVSLHGHISTGEEEVLYCDYSTVL